MGTYEQNVYWGTEQNLSMTISFKFERKYVNEFLIKGVTW